MAHESQSEDHHADEAAYARGDRVQAAPSGCAGLAGADGGGCDSHNRGDRGLRDELLDGEVFYSLREAEIIIASWRRHDNAVRPHASLGYRPPAPEVFVPAFAAWPAAQAGSASPATLPLAPTPALN